MPEQLKKYTLAVITPLANEESTISEFLSRVTRQLEEQDRFFCVLDRVSTDRTREIVEEFAQVDPRVICVWAPENRCVVDAYFAGYRSALATNANWILEMDGGMSHSPEDIPKFREAISEGKYDYIGGCRFGSGGAHRGNISRHLISRTGTIVSNLMLGTKLKDMTGGFQCFSRSSLQHIVDQGVKSRAHFFQTEIKFLLRDHRCHEIPIIYESPSASVNRAVIWESCRNLVAMARDVRIAAS